MGTPDISDLARLLHGLPGVAYRCRWDGTWQMGFVSEGSRILLGLEPAELVGPGAVPWHRLIHPSDLERTLSGIRTAIDGGLPFRLEYRVFTKEGIERWVRDEGLVIVGSGDEPIHLEGFVHNISPQKQAEVALTDADRTIERLTREDPLTGLYNRRALEDYMTRAMSFSRRWKQPLSMILADIDRFKDINDRHGHLVGDQVLIAFAALLRASCRIEDVVARFGGEEFVLLLANTALGDAKVLAERLRAGVESAAMPLPDTVTASFGLAAYVPGDTRETFLERADRALYVAKSAGRNLVRSTVDETGE